MMMGRQDAVHGGGLAFACAEPSAAPYGTALTLAAMRVPCRVAPATLAAQGRQQRAPHLQTAVCRLPVLSVCYLQPACMGPF